MPVLTRQPAPGGPPDGRSPSPAPLRRACRVGLSRASRRSKGRAATQTLPTNGPADATPSRRGSNGPGQPARRADPDKDWSFSHSREWGAGYPAADRRADADPQIPSASKATMAAALGFEQAERLRASNPNMAVAGRRRCRRSSRPMRGCSRRGEWAMSLAGRAVGRPLMSGVACRRRQRASTPACGDLGVQPRRQQRRCSRGPDPGSSGIAEAVATRSSGDGRRVRRGREVVRPWPLELVRDDRPGRNMGARRGRASRRRNVLDCAQTIDALLGIGNPRSTAIPGD